MREELEKAIVTAREVSNPPPQNETETCHRIIYPLLLAAGYGYLDIRAQDIDAAKSRPDYTLLANHPDHTWFLEAKTWNVTLEDHHAIQAINYANTQGKRWAVLSNGREWRLYDNHISGTADLKLATTCRLEDEGFLSFLESIAKPSILANKLEGFVRNQRLYTTLDSQLSKPDSDLIKAIVKYLKSIPGLASVTATDVAGYFAPEHDAVPAAGESVQLELEDSPAPSEVGQEVQFHLGQQFDFRYTEKPRATIAGEEFSGTYFTDFMKAVLENLLAQNLVFPEDSGKNQGVFFTVNETIAKQQMKNPVRIVGAGNGVWYEMHRSANNHLRMLKRILIQNEMPLEQCIIVATRYK